MRHLLIALGLLAALVVLFLVLKWVFTPASFGEYGFYRGENVSEHALMEAEYAGPVSECRTCHTTQYDAWAASEHATVNCQTCHGPAQAHLETGAALQPFEFTDVSELCLLCHTKLTSRPASFPQVDPAEHNAPTSCQNCHDPHEPEKTECLTCHPRK